jgi:glycosyltransferase involved in cell wall biosynthesis
MNVLLVANGFPPTARAGVEQYTHALARSLRESGHGVQVFCREASRQKTDYTVLDGEDEGIPVRRVVNNLMDAVRPEDFYRNPRIEGLFRKALAEWRPDIIHFQHVIGLSATLLPVAAELGTSHLLTLHDYWYMCPTVHLLDSAMQLCVGAHRGADCERCLGSVDAATRRLHRLSWYRRLKDSVPESWWDPAQRLATRALAAVPRAGPAAGDRRQGPAAAARVADMREYLASCPCFVAPSHFVRDAYAGFGLPSERIEVIPLGMNPAGGQSSVAEGQGAYGRPGLRVGYIGTLYPHKGVDILISAFRQVESPTARLAIHGYGSAEDPYPARLRALARGDRRITFMGPYDNRRVPELLAVTDVLVIPSRWHETFSIAAREALLAGVPVIASHVGAIPEVIRHEQNGLLVPPGDVAALASAIAQLAGDPGRVARLRPSGRLPVSSMADHASAMVRLYGRLIAGTYP